MRKSRHGHSRQHGARRAAPACTLGPDDWPARMRRWEALARKGRPIARRSGHRLEVRYQPEPGVRDALEALAAAERKCCAFVAWT